MQQHWTTRVNRYHILIVVAAVLWILTSTSLVPPGRAGNRSAQQLSELAEHIERYAKKNGAVPRDIDTLWAYASSRGATRLLHSPSGQRVTYTRIGERFFLLRAFYQRSWWGQKERLGTRGLLQWGEKNVSGLTYRPVKPGQFHAFPGVLLAGQDSPNGRWHTRIMIDKELGKTWLVAQERANPDQIRVSRHDHVEEFIWLPNSTHVVYSATSSSRYDDGIYLWNPETDQQRRLTKARNDRGVIDLSGDIGPQWISLLGVNQRGTTLYALQMPAYNTPTHLWQPTNIKTFGLGFGEIAMPKMPPPKSASFLVAADVFVGSPTKTSGLTAQKRWFQPLQSDGWEALVEKWQEYTYSIGSSALLPYALLRLVIYYAESYNAALTKSPKRAHVLRSYGAEIAKTLAQYQPAPSYLRAQAATLWQEFTNGRRIKTNYLYAWLPPKPLP